MCIRGIMWMVGTTAIVGNRGRGGRVGSRPVGFHHLLPQIQLQLLRRQVEVLLSVERTKIPSPCDTGHVSEQTAVQDREVCLIKKRILREKWHR